LRFWPREMRGTWISFVCVFCWRIVPPFKKKINK
jgi:hypothetical protein